MTPPGDRASSTQRAKDGGQTKNPQGAYTKVKVVPILGGPGLLSDGTGTLGATFTFSAGQFTQGDLPEIGKYYNIFGFHDGDFYEFPRWRCTHSGGTSDFTEN
ncbi:hypothetical protein [Alloactinosynnema sp. L-07]|uniref:hypothetical protein n=1 Tax=Alloactinosynnema sp. L-07 TaxID=1653480 RepID=UPI00065F084A|nr:hypothetical protein [Alloactinosynnema sp. L-07]CRK60292.1 hypothetical protein [Alloactinosynnema sp. L-07]